MYTSCGFQSNLQVHSSLARAVTVDSEVPTNSRTLHTLNVMHKLTNLKEQLKLWNYKKYKLMEKQNPYRERIINLCDEELLKAYELNEDYQPLAREVIIEEALRRGIIQQNNSNLIENEKNSDNNEDKSSVLNFKILDINTLLSLLQAKKYVATLKNKKTIVVEANDLKFLFSLNKDFSIKVIIQIPAVWTVLSIIICLTLFFYIFSKSAEDFGNLVVVTLLVWIPILSLSQFIYRTFHKEKINSFTKKVQQDLHKKIYFKGYYIK